MEPTLKKQSRTRSVLLIIGLLGLVLTSIFLSRRSAHAVQQMSVAIYQDRLVPTGILVNLTSAVYRKRLLLETLVLTTDPTDSQNHQLVSATLGRLNRRIDSLLTEFRQTKLTPREADRLQLLTNRLSIYNGLETNLTSRQASSSGSRRVLFADTGRASFSQVVQTLDELSALQLTVGESLLSESRGQTNGIFVLTAVQIGLVLFIGLSLFWYQF